MSFKKILFSSLFLVCCTVIFSETTDFTIIDMVHPYNLDPHTANYSSDAQILTGLYEGLFTYDPATLEPQPALAESFKISRDKLRWTFTIKENARFSNGDAITAQSIKDAWIAVLNPELQAPLSSLLDCIKGAREYRTGTGSAEDVGITVQGRQKLTVTLTSPTEYFDSILCHHAFSAVSPKKGVYSGPFILESYQDNILIMKKNPQYYDAENVVLDTITVIQSDDLAENAYSFNTGSADWIISAASVDSIIDYQSIVINAQFATEYLFFKADRAPWNRADFRNALLAAVPWAELRSQAFVPAETFIYPVYGYESPAGINDTDMDEARLLLAQAKENAGMSSDEPLEITIAVSDTEYMFSQAALLKQAWEELGITVHISKTPESRYLSSISGWVADIFSYTWIGDFSDPLAFLELFRSGSSMKESAWSNPEYDRLLQDAALENSGERLELLSQAEDVLLSDGVVLPISHPVTLNIIDQQAVGGWYPNALDIHPLKYLTPKQAPLFIPNLVMAE